MVWFLGMFYQLLGNMEGYGRGRGAYLINFYLIRSGEVEKFVDEKGEQGERVGI